MAEVELGPAGDIVAVALSQVGIRESSGKNDGIPSERYAGGRQEPYCAHFIAWLFRQTGRPLPGDVVPTRTRANPLASVAFMHRVFKEHGWLVVDPRPGDVVFMKTRGRSDRGPGHHVALVVGVELAGAEACLHCVDANWGNAVCRVQRRKSDPSIWAFGRPS